MEIEVDEEKIYHLLRENAIPEEYNKRMARSNGTFLFIEGSYIKYLAHALATHISEWTKIIECKE